VRIDQFVSYDDDEARREAMFFLAKSGRSAGYELWRDSRKMDEFKFASPPDPRTSEMEAELCGLAPADELAYRYLLRDHFSRYRRDPVWKGRIAELEGQLDAAAASAHASLAPILHGR
jgi:hypothetical protein